MREPHREIGRHARAEIFLVAQRLIEARRLQYSLGL
jgi:hypothetical protein